MPAQAQLRLSPEEYLQLERSAEQRHEYYQGEMFAMSGGTSKHSRITANLTGELYAALKGTPCSMFSSDLRIRVSQTGLYTYPDIAIVCGEPAYVDQREDTLVNPTFIVEVLSPSTEAYDRGFKAAQYRQLSSLAEYVLVSQAEPRIEILSRQSGGDWLFCEAAGLRATCRFNTLNCKIALAEIYAGIVFAPENPLALHPSA